MNQVEDDHPVRIIWLPDGPFVATQPIETTMCRIDEGRAIQSASCMASAIIRPATPEDVEEWKGYP